MDFIEKDDRELVEALNIALGMKNRSKPYDLKNINDLIEATKMATGEYLDLLNYACGLDRVLEAYDESLEYYHTAIWVELAERKKDPFAKAYLQLKKTCDLFDSLTDRVLKNCLLLWEAVLNNKQSSEYYFGRIYPFTNFDFDEICDFLIEHLHEINYDGKVENSTAEFVALLSRWLENKDVDK